MSLDATWHQANPMPPNPTYEQRVEWHREHALAVRLPQAARRHRRAPRAGGIAAARERFRARPTRVSPAPRVPDGAPRGSGGSCAPSTAAPPPARRRCGPSHSRAPKPRSTFLSVCDGRGLRAARRLLGPAAGRTRARRVRWTARGAGVPAETDLRHHSRCRRDDPGGRRRARPARARRLGPLDDVAHGRSPYRCSSLVPFPPRARTRATCWSRPTPHPPRGGSSSLAGTLGRGHGFRPVLLYIGPAAPRDSAGVGPPGHGCSGRPPA